MQRALKTALAGFGALLATGLAASTAQAAVIASLSFDTPTGVVGPTDPIPVWLTLTLDKRSDPITTDALGHLTSPLSPQAKTELGGAPTDVIVNLDYICGGTFTAGCADKAYSFQFNFTPPVLIDPMNLDLQPGSSTSWLFGTFVPLGAGAPNGTYSFYDARLEFSFFDGASGQQYFSTIADTCDPSGSTCAFTRTVMGGAAPEPATWALMIGGFGLAGVALRRRRGVVAA